MGDRMLLRGLDRGEPTLLACEGLWDMEPRCSMFGEHGTGVPRFTGLCTVKLPKLAEQAEEEMALLTGLQSEDAMFEGLQPEQLLSLQIKGLLTVLLTAPPFRGLSEHGTTDLGDVLVLFSKNVC